MGKRPAQIATEELIRTLWQERFPQLEFIPDFLRTWTVHRVSIAISAFDETAKYLKRYPEKTALDL